MDGILDRLQERPASLVREYDTLRNLVSTHVAADLKGTDRARVLAERADAASKLGQAETAIEFWQKVLAETAGLRGSVSYLDRSDWAWQYGLALDVGGHVGDSMAQLQEALRIVQGRPAGRRLLPPGPHPWPRSCVRSISGREAARPRQCRGSQGRIVEIK